jgi:hypothetical protein
MEEHAVATRQFLRDFAFVCAAAFGIGGAVAVIAAGVVLLVA